MSCSNQIDSNNNNSNKQNQFQQINLNNNTMKDYPFLKGMYEDSYYPKNLVDKLRNILINLCSDIETQSPKNIEGLYKLTHQATNKINILQFEFEENNSEIETVAREIIAEDFDNISKAYGFNADIEELIATREW